MKKISNIFTVILLISLCSCHSLGNKRTKELYHANIKKQSINNIISRYGYYNSKWTDSNGNKIYNFTYKQAQYDPLIYFPILAYFGGTIHDNYEVILIYDKNNKFIEKKNFYNKFKSGTRLTCSSCIKKFYDEKPLAPVK